MSSNCFICLEPARYQPCQCSMACHYSCWQDYKRHTNPAFFRGPQLKVPVAVLCPICRRRIKSVGMFTRSQRAALLEIPVQLTIYDLIEELFAVLDHPLERERYWKQLIGYFKWRWHFIKELGWQKRLSELCQDLSGIIPSARADYLFVTGTSLE